MVERFNFHENGFDESEIKALHSTHLPTKPKKESVFENERVKEQKEYQLSNRQLNNKNCIYYRMRAQKYIYIHGICMESKEKRKDKRRRRKNMDELTCNCSAGCVSDLLCYKNKNKMKKIFFFSFFSRMHIVNCHSCATRLTVF